MLLQREIPRTRLKEKWDVAFKDADGGSMTVPFSRNRPEGSCHHGTIRVA